ncbi:alginate lyase-domain-containing protein [Mycena capillaripes]|nr:alginate lyase-domain-containing protein [Mycena capillaripes]
MSLAVGFSNWIFLPYRITFSLCVLLSFSQAALSTNLFTQYPVDFPDPNEITAGNFGARFAGAESTIIAWAEDRASYGPWTVTNKPVLAPSNNTHDYMSWAPYQWPNCSNVKNTTVLSLSDMWMECNYEHRDGRVNPDRSTILDFESFANLSDAVLYNSIAATLQNKSSSVYSQNVAKFINTWFLDADTRMNPNVLYGQMDGGPNGQIGTFTGILDLRGFAKIASGILMLRKTGNSDWTTDLDTQMIAWCKEYIEWLLTSSSGRRAAKATNNHGTIFVSQFASLKLIVNDTAGAVNWTHNYFTGIFQNQVNSSGDQPMEAIRTRPYHYRNFNLAGMITNARLLAYADPDAKPWNAAANGTTIQKVADFLMTIDPAASGEQNDMNEIYPNVAAVASAYGDSDGKYVKFLNARGFPYVDEPTFLWSQPLADGDSLADNNNGSNSGAGSPTGQSGERFGGVGGVQHMFFLAIILLAAAVEFL